MNEMDQGGNSSWTMRGRLAVMENAVEVEERTIELDWPSRDGLEAPDRDGFHCPDTANNLRRMHGRGRVQGRLSSDELHDRFLQNGHDRR